MKWKKKTVVSCNNLTVLSGTNCPMGGDAGHGGKTIVQFIDDAATCWNIYVNGNKIEENPEKITIELLGDSECETMIEALEFAAKSLRTIYNINKENDDNT